MGKTEENGTHRREKIVMYMFLDTEASRPNV